MVKNVSEKNGIDVTITNIENPRTELMDHYYNAKNTCLKDLGLNPIYLNEECA